MSQTGQNGQNGRPRAATTTSLPIITRGSIFRTPQRRQQLQAGQAPDAQSASQAQYQGSRASLLSSPGFSFFSTATDRSATSTTPHRYGLRARTASQASQASFSTSTPSRYGPASYRQHQQFLQQEQQQHHQQQQLSTPTRSSRGRGAIRTGFAPWQQQQQQQRDSLQRLAYSNSYHYNSHHCTDGFARASSSSAVITSTPYRNYNYSQSAMASGGKWREEQVLVICPGSRTTMAQLGCGELSPPTHRIPTRMFRDEEDAQQWRPYYTYKRTRVVDGVEHEEWVEDVDEEKDAVWPIEGKKLLKIRIEMK